MAEKARIYDVTFRDGRGAWTEKIAGQSKNQIENNLDISHHVTVLSIKHRDWHKFYAQPNETNDGVDFVSENGDLRVTTRDLGYSYLLQQYPEQVAEVMGHLEIY